MEYPSALLSTNIYFLAFNMQYRHRPTNTDFPNTATDYAQKLEICMRSLDKSCILWVITIFVVVVFSYPFYLHFADISSSSW